MFAYLMEMIWYEVLGVWNLSLCFTSELKALHRTALVANCQIPYAGVVLVAWSLGYELCLFIALRLRISFVYTGAGATRMELIALSGLVG
jgi:hypothetical protein